MKFQNSDENDISYGITTGSLATATALTALNAIIHTKISDFINIVTPYEELNVEIDYCKKINNNKAEAGAIKYPYNDPDVTVNLEIAAIVELIDYKEKENEKNQKNKVTVIGGKGVGTITKPGLQLSPNEPAINPIPLKMIKKNLSPHVPSGKIAKVEIIVPKGEEIAKKTMNPRLGIEGGISILGTTGIARSMSTSAYKKSLLCQIDIAIGQKFPENSLIFVPGNIGEKLALEQLKVDKDQIIHMGNYVGYMLEAAETKGIRELTLFGHVGKLVKIAGGIFNTKHSIADGRKEIIAAHAGLCGVKKKIIQKIFDSKTTEEMINILKDEKKDIEVMNSITLAIKEILHERFRIKVNVILVDMKGNRLASK